MPSHIELTDEDVTFLLTFLRNSSNPMTTQQLIDVLRKRLPTEEETAVD
ncbi:MAG: hypothetical protein ACRDJW_16980 [Thermomicrobiales bacterium]